MFPTPLMLRNTLAFLLAFVCLTLAQLAQCAGDSDQGDSRELVLIGWVGEAPSEAPPPLQSGDEGANDIFEFESEEVLLDDSVWPPFVQPELGVSPVGEGLVFRSGSSPGVDRPPQV